jgi:hypothetical protein
MCSFLQVFLSRSSVDLLIFLDVTAASHHRHVCDHSSTSSWSRALHKKLGAELFKKFSIYYEIQMGVKLCTGARYRTLDLRRVSSGRLSSQLFNTHS